MSAPLYEALIKKAQEESLRFCMPGHKAGALYEDSSHLYKMDTTELADTDNLHHPKGIILEAQRLAACAFGAKKSFFLVNGSSCGIMAMLWATCANKKVLVDRNCHLSVIHALAFCGAEAVFITPEYDVQNGRFSKILPGTLTRALEKNPDAAAVFVTSPSYYGTCQDLASLAKAAHAHGAYLLVDEAHGAHFAFSERLPETALLCGADITVQSVHKTLPALTQSAILHAGNEELVEKIEEAARLFQSTSPSYLLMAHIDKARQIMEEEPSRMEQLIDWIEEIFGEKPRPDRDITRLVFKFDNMSGFTAAERLREKNIIVEMADAVSVVCIATVSDTKEALVCLKKAVDELRQEPGERPKQIAFPTHEPEFRMTVRDAFFAEEKFVPLNEAVGEIAKEAVVVYPPGVPTLVPGAKVTQSDINYVKDMLALGAEVHGIRDGRVRVVKRP